MNLPENQNKPVDSKLIIGLTAITVMVVGVCGWALSARPSRPAPQSYSKIPDMPSEKDKQQASRRQDKCQAGLTYYENESLGFVFCYPEPWGKTTLSDARLSPKDSGQRWLIGFNSKPQAKIIVVSSDWSTSVSQQPVCHEPIKTLPSTHNVSYQWKQAGTEVAYRTIEFAEDVYVINEVVDTSLGGACMLGYTSPAIQTYGVVNISYFREFGSGIISPSSHIKNPLILLPEVDRQAIRTVVLSVEKY